MAEVTDDDPDNENDLGADDADEAGNLIGFIDDDVEGDAGNAETDLHLYRSLDIRRSSQKKPRHVPENTPAAAARLPLRCKTPWCQTPYGRPSSTQRQPRKRRSTKKEIIFKDCDELKRVATKNGGSEVTLALRDIKENNPHDLDAAFAFITTCLGDDEAKVFKSRLERV